MSRPEFVSNEDETFLEIRNGRHPCEERNVMGIDFTSNDTVIGTEGDELKPTHMRQIGLTCIIAHLGCYVPADRCQMSPRVRIFARLGASDHIVSGESTFFEELSETSCMLKHATENSLVLMGREEWPNDKEFKEFLNKLRSDDPIEEAQILLYAGFIDLMRDKGISWLRGHFKPILDDISKEVDKHKKSPGLKIRLTKILDFFTRNETLATIFMDYDCVLRQDTSFEESFVGKIFSLVPDPYFFSIDPIEVGQIETEGHEFMDFLSHLLHDFFNKLLKFGSELKRQTLMWIGEALHTLMYRSESLSLDHLDQLIYENNLLINLQNVLLMLLKPFLNDQSKVVNMQHNYCMATAKSEVERHLRNIHLKEIADSFLVPLASVEGSSSAPLEDQYEMPTEIFYMAHLAFYLGFSAIHGKFPKLELNISQKIKRCSELAVAQEFREFVNYALLKELAELSLLQYHKTLLMQNQLLERSFRLMAFTAKFLVATSPQGSSNPLISRATLPLPSDNLDRYLGHIPKFLAENIIGMMTFLKRTEGKDKYLEGRYHKKDLRSMFEFLLIFMHSSTFLHDSLTKVKSAKMFYRFFLKSQPHTYRGELATNNVNACHSMSCIMRLYVGMEPNIFGSYKGKLKILPIISSIFNHLYKIELHKTALVELVMDAECRMDYEDEPLFLKFINHLRKDAFNFMEEALMLMIKIRRIPEAERQGQSYLDDMKLAQSCNSMAEYILSIFTKISHAANHILHNPVMAEILARMLHCYLGRVVGQGSVDGQVENSVAFHFNSRQILSMVCLIYEDFWENTNVLTAISRISRRLLAQAGDALDLINEPRILIDEIAATIDELAQEEEERIERLRIIPRSFLDMRTRTIMQDRVRVGDRVIDRKTFIKELLKKNPIFQSSIMTPGVDLKKIIDAVLRHN